MSMVRRDQYREFRWVGRDLMLTGLVTTHGGNMSLRSGENLVITRRGSMLGRLQPEDLVTVALEGEDSRLAAASSEWPAHMAIYRETRAGAVIHAHPASAILLSLLEASIAPADVEGARHLGVVPVVSPAAPAGSQEVAGLVAAALRDHRVVMVRGHGSFAAGGRLEEALALTSTLETSCRILCLARSLGAVGKP